MFSKEAVKIIGRLVRGMAGSNTVSIDKLEPSDCNECERRSVKVKGWLPTDYYKLADEYERQKMFTELQAGYMNLDVEHCRLHVYDIDATYVGRTQVEKERDMKLAWDNRHKQQEIS